MANRRGLEIKAAAAGDAPLLIDLLAEADSAVDAATLAINIDGLRREGGTALMAQEWGSTSGLIVLHWYRSFVGPRGALISLLIVAAEARRRGVGRLLLKAGAQAARTAGCDKVSALVPADLDVLTAFCRATGFAEDGVTFTRSLRKRG